MTIDDQLNAIPREHLVAMLKEAAYYSGDQRGYSYDVSHETAIRGILYRGEPLFKTQEEAILAHWKRHYQKDK